MEINLFLPFRFPELESPRFSKALRTAAFAYPFLFDNLPLFYRVRALLRPCSACRLELMVFLSL